MEETSMHQPNFYQDLLVNLYQNPIPGASLKARVRLIKPVISFSNSFAKSLLKTHFFPPKLNQTLSRTDRRVNNRLLKQGFPSWLSANYTFFIWSK
jgi:hypothetical protein